jgi:putative acyl-CoA dehydrogenase
MTSEPRPFKLEPTHEVKNQPPPLVNYNLFTGDKALAEALHREGGGFAEARLTAFGKLLGSEDVIALGPLANRNPPVLHTHDRYGNRRDEVEFHPAWHELLRISKVNELHASPWREPREGAHVARAAMGMVANQIEAGHACPITMTFGAVPALRKQPEIAAEWEPRIHLADHDARFIPASEKRGVLLGMAMTEKQGGSDVRANTTRAVPIGAGGPGGEYAITGHKWFCSAPMCDAFLMLAHAPKGLSCFLVPRFLPDGSKNRIFLQRLKDKLGNRSNASSEIELDGTWGRMVGDEGRGVPTIIEMANHTRLDCVIGSAALMRKAVAEALHHATHRAAFGRALIDQPLMRNVLADLCVESEGATALMMRLARSYDRQDDRTLEGPYRRIATAIAKYWVTKRAVPLVGEALECLGGNGYVEDSAMPRLFRESPLNSIWEGSGNVICLDVLRAMVKEPGALEACLTEIRAATGQDRRYDAFVRGVEADLARTDEVEGQARRLVERMALALTGSLLVRHGNAAVADAFCASRLSGDGYLAFGTLPAKLDLGAIIDRARPT